VQQYLAETDDVEYSIPSCRRLLKEARLSYQNHAAQPPNLMPMSKKRFERKLQKRREMDATVVAIDQTKKSVQVEPRATWFPRGTRPSVELSGQRDWTCLLGAITEDGDRFSPHSKSTSPPNTRNILFCRYEMSSKVI